MPSDTERQFYPGDCVLTAGVIERITDDGEFARFVTDSLKRHIHCDWGDLCKEDKAENELALKEGNLRLFSVYDKPPLPKIWIITEADRSATTVLFPNEY